MTVTVDGSTSDGFHTFDELYELRLLLHAHAARAWVAEGIPVVRSWRHHDGEECFGGGWFIVTAQLPTGQVSNHYPVADWRLFEGVPTAATAPEWDGHDTRDVADRLRAALGSQLPAPRALPLTARERQILGMVAAGHTGQEMATALGLAPNTVAQHLASVRRKYGVHSSAAAVDIARRAGEITEGGNE